MDACGRACGRVRAGVRTRAGGRADAGVAGVALGGTTHVNMISVTIGLRSKSYASCPE